MVGNPYASTIDLNQLYNDNIGTSPNLSSNFYELYNKNPGQAYVVWSATGGTSGTNASRYIASGQGFMTVVTATNQTLVFKEGQKVYNPALINSSSTPPLLLTTPKSDILALGKGAANTSFKNFNAAEENALSGLHMMIQKDSVTTDECGIYFGKKWSDDYDIDDAYDLDGVGPKVYMSSLTADKQRTAINKLSDYKSGKKVKLYVKATADGMYNLTMTDLQNIDPTAYKITLLDNFKKDSLDIGKYKTYNFNITNADTTTFGEGRFELSIKPIPGPKYQLASFTAQKANDGVLVTWRALNEGNNYAYTLEKLGADGSAYSPLYQTQSNGATIYKYTDKTPNTGNNVYRLKQVDLFGTISYAGPVNIYYDKSGNNNMFNIYPNPTAETLNVNVTYGKTNNTTALSYKLNIYDITGSVIMQKTGENSNFSQNVSQFKPGVYIVELQDNEGSSLGKTKFVKK